MAKRRFLIGVSTLVVALLAAIVPAVSAQTPPSQTQEGPFSVWNQPGAEPLDGLGAWVYVAPKAVPGTEDPYDYLLRWDLSGTGASQGMGFIGLATRPEGTMAGMSLVSSVPQATVLTPFNWSPGHFYYLLVYRSSTDHWVGWVYDYSAQAWTIVGQLTAPVGGGLLSPSSRTLLEQATGRPCAGYPRSDVFFYPPVGYRGTTVSLATLGSHGVAPGECPTATSVEYDWVHYRLGTAPSAA
jgi:hypothetical protein